ncbi:VTC domain-containing protein [Ruminococcus sp.]
MSYQRAAYFGKDDPNFRLTFDRALTVILSLYRYEDQVYDK